MGNVRVDTSDLGKLAARFEAAAEDLPRGARGVVEKGSLNVKNDARKRVGSGGYIGAYALTIGYDITETPARVTGEVGPDKSKQVGGGPKRTPGNLGPLLEYEYGKPWSSPRPHLGPALDAEAPRFEKAMEDLALKVIDL